MLTLRQLLSASKKASCDALPEGMDSRVGGIVRALSGSESSALATYRNLVHLPKPAEFQLGYANWQSALLYGFLAFGLSGVKEVYKLAVDNADLSEHCLNVLNCAAAHSQTEPSETALTVLSKLSPLWSFMEETAALELMSRILELLSDHETARNARDLHDRLVRHTARDDEGRSKLLHAFQDFPKSVNGRNLLWGAISVSALTISDEICDGLHSLIEEDNPEITYQKFLERYPALLDPLALEVIPGKRLAERYKTDFVIRRLDNEYVFVELEKPSDPPFTQYPQPSTQLSHALGQVLSWFIWLEDNINYDIGLPGIHSPKGPIVIGRDSDLSALQRRMLNELNAALSPRIRVVTFDYVVSSSRNVLRNLTAATK